MFNATLSHIRELREYLTPVSHVSSFKKTGQITPEEFVVAGDYLVYKFPTWSWASASPSKRKDYLPADKQYLVTKHVPSHLRSAAFEGGAGENDEVEEGEDGWVTAVKHRGSTKQPAAPGTTASEDEEEEIEEIVDIDEQLEDNEQGDVYQDKSTTGPSRTYNLYIAYSTAYRVPKLYLSGFNANGGPLSPDEMFEDIISDYKDKTVTIERAPFEDDLTLISIHPCRHASVMKVLLDRAEQRLRNQMDEEDVEKGIAQMGLADQDEWEEVEVKQGDDEGVIRVDQYLVIFLKFVASVTPGIEHDYTMAAL
ncbi:autophagy-related protein 3 [Trichomonascus vanleenenianus]|uniref:Atg3p n=1 Tax=Trichomonascus vanleenenianus TaxID=2268995 RepID=UPI003ECA8A86